MSDYASYRSPKFFRELRLGLVVYGELSTAIYTNGICQEFYHAVRGRGIYKLMKALVDAETIVDVISGTSAAGVNGILLSYALANTNDRELINFSSFAKIWRNSGDLIALVNRQEIDRLQTNDDRLVREGYDRQELIDAMERVTNSKLPRPDHEWFSPASELDLFITATDYLGKVERQLDEGKGIGEIKSHHTLFHLQHREGRQEDFNPSYTHYQLNRSAQETYQAIAKLCRISSSIPVLFPSVAVDIQSQDNLVDRQLVWWGNLQERSGSVSTHQDGHKLYFCDGGLLDHAPSDHILKALSDRSGSRTIFYVDPTPPAITNSPRRRDRKKSSTDRGMRSGVLSHLMSESVINDLRSMAEHNAKIDRYQTLLARSEIAIGSRSVVGLGIQNSPEIYLRIRALALRHRCLPLLLQLPQGEHPRTYPGVIDKISSLFKHQAEKQFKPAKLAKLLRRFETQIVNLDIEYSLRKHFYLCQKIQTYLQLSINDDTRFSLQQLAKKLKKNIELLEVINTSLEILLSDRVVSNYFYYLVQRESNEDRLHALIYEIIFRLHRFLLDGTRLKPLYIRTIAGVNVATITTQFWLDLPDFAVGATAEKWLPTAEISGAFAQLKQRIESIHHARDLHKLLWMDRGLEYDGKNNNDFPSILRQIIAAGEVMIARSANQFTDILLKQWHDFRDLDRAVYPFEFINQIQYKDRITTVKVSPDDAQMGLGRGKSSQDKLAGDKLYPAGGLFKKSWKSNDLLWGRLDGLNRILEGIITPQSVTAFSHLIDRESRKNNCTPSLYLDWLLTESLPQLTGAKRQKIRNHLDRLSQPNLPIDSAELQKILADLVLAGQQEILTSDVNYVLEGIGENYRRSRLLHGERQSAHDWIVNQIAPQSRQVSDPGMIVHPKAIYRIEQQSLSRLASQRQNFFRERYRFAADQLWVNLPLGTILTVSMRIVLVLRDFLVNAMSKFNRRRLVIHPLYRWLDGALQSVYWWLQGGNIKLASAHTRPRLLFFQALGLGMAGGGIVLGILSSPVWLLLSIPGLTSWWFLQTVRLKRLTAAKKRPFLPESKE
jgi:patatin-related protein